MDINNTLITEYAKKIYGFAYSKTHNYHDAHDLAQDILLTMWKLDFSSKPIRNMDAYIYRVCQYTWSNFVRRNKHEWEYLGYSDEIESVQCENSVEDEIVKQEEYQKLRREIAYLGEMKRKAMIMFYYDDLSGKEISEKLKIPASTVRWYIGESKKILKERIQMTEGIYIPKKLKVYFCGNSNDKNLAGLRDDLLVQNICIACEEKALTIEEIAVKLSMSAAFIENKLEGLLYMNYIEKVGANKYKTAFFIQDADFIIAKKHFEMKRFPGIANAIYNAVKNHLAKLRDIGFSGSDLDENFLMWAFTTIVAHNYYNRNARSLPSECPIHGDGSSHWIDARLEDDEIIKSLGDSDAELADYMKYSGGSAGKHMCSNIITMQQFDPPLVCGDRVLRGSMEINNLNRVYEIISGNIEPGETDKEMISHFVEKGYVSVCDGVAKIMIPYFTPEEYEQFCSVIDNDVLQDVEKEVGTSLVRDYADYIKKNIPGYVSENEKNFLMSRLYQPNAYPYLLYKQGLLKMPSADEAKRICTIVWKR